MLAAGEGERRGMELAELELGELRAGGVGEHRARRRSRPRGWWSAARAPRRRRSPAPWQGAAIVPRSVTTPAQRSPSLHRASADAPSSTSIPGSAATSSASRPVIARPVSLPPAWTMRRAECPPSSPSAAHRPGSVSKLDAALAQLLDGRRAPPAVSTSTAEVRHSPRPAASVSAAWRSGESSAASAAASPPWAQKLELSASGLRETSSDRGPLARRPRARRAGPAAPPPTTTTSQRGRALGARRTSSRWRLRYPERDGPLLRPPLLAATTTPARTPRTRGALRRDRGSRSSARAGPASSGSSAPAGDPRAARARPRRGALSTRSRSSAPRGGGMIDMDTRRQPGAPSTPPCTRRAARCAAAERLLGGEAKRRLLRAAPARPSRRARPGDGLLPLQQRRGRRRRTRSPTSGAERVLVLDWDVHHGNGTEAIFAVSPDVLYVSIHQWPLYPGTGAAEYAGEGAGEGYTVNLPVPPGRGQRRVPARWSSTSSCRSPASYAPGPDRDLGRLRRPPRRPARLLPGRDRRPTAT